jgi:hypothetical protein
VLHPFYAEGIQERKIEKIAVPDDGALATLKAVRVKPWINASYSCLNTVLDKFSALAKRFISRRA